MDWVSLAYLLTGLLGLLSAYFGSRYAKVKKKIRQIAQLVNDIDKALEDNRITEEELKKIIKDLKAIIE